MFKRVPRRHRTKKRIFREYLTLEKPSGVDLTEKIFEAEKILGITMPQIKFVDYLFEDTDGSIVAQTKFNKDQIPENAGGIGAFFNDKTNEIILPVITPALNEETMETYYIKKTDAEMFFSILHEMRHVWQKENDYDLYFKHNARNFEAIHDLSEIDADAFALAYSFSEKAGFTYLDFPSSMLEIAFQASVDKGERIKRAEELALQYGFGNLDKMNEAFSEGVNYDTIKVLAAALPK